MIQVVFGEEFVVEKMESSPNRGATMRLDDQLTLSENSILRLEKTEHCCGYLYRFRHLSGGPADDTDSIILETISHYVKFEALFIKIKLVWCFPDNNVFTLRIRS